VGSCVYTFTCFTVDAHVLAPGRARPSLKYEPSSEPLHILPRPLSACSSCSNSLSSASPPWNPFPPEAGPSRTRSSHGTEGEGGRGRREPSAPLEPLPLEPLPLEPFELRCARSGMCGEKSTYMRLEVMRPTGPLRSSARSQPEFGFREFGFSFLGGVHRVWV